MRKKKITILIILLFFIVVFIFIHYMDKRIEQKGILLNAMTTEWVGRVNMGIHLQYEFFYNGKKIIGERGFKNVRGNQDFQRKSFPVMYDPKFGSSQLLVEPADFNEFNLPYPDSLKWVLKYIQ
jgi:hypothetical protein